MKQTYFLPLLLFALSLSAQPVLVKDVFPNGDAVPRSFHEYNGQLLFSAIAPGFGRELWISDGTAVGTMMLGDINSDPDLFDGNANPASMITFAEKVYFRANDGVHGSELWVTDGTLEGTQLLIDIFPGQEGSSPTDFVILENTLYFTADDGVHGQELWRTDGTSAGTTLVLDINSGPGPSAPVFKTVIGDWIYFSAGDGANSGVELWSSDGTAAGTQLVKDIDPDGNSFPFGFIAFKDEVFFIASTTENGPELWKTDGTAEGTMMVAEVNPNGSGGLGDLFVLGNFLFFQADDGEHGGELWVSDGTSVGTQLLADINPGEAGSFPSQFTSTLDLLEEAYFVASTDMQGSELWRLTVDDAATIDDILLVQVQDINAGSADANPQDLVFNGDALYFSAEDAQYGRELYRLPLNEPTASRLTDINTEASSLYNGIEQVGRKLFFPATDGDSGDELWTLSVPVPVLQAGDLEGTLVSGDTLHFGTVAVGNSKQLFVSIASVGSADLLIGDGNFLSPEAPFFYSGPPLVVIYPPGTSATVSYLFEPTVVGEFIEEVRLESNDLDQTPFVLYLRGTADSEDGVRELKQLSVMAFPNPVQDRVYLKLGEGLSDGRVYLYDMQGGVLWQQSIPDAVREIELRVGDWPTGNYLLEIRDATLRGTVKLIKQ